MMLVWDGDKFKFEAIGLRVAASGMCECIIFSRSRLLGFHRSSIIGSRMRLNYYNNTNNNILVLASGIQSLYPSTSFASTPNKLYYTKASASSSHDDDDDVIQQQERSAAAAAFSRPNFLQLDDYKINERKSHRLNFDGSNNNSLTSDADASLIIRRKRQTMNRSSILAKQVITIHSAITLGFVSQLWLDTSSWLVLVVELRPNLLSAQAERFLLHDIHQVGDVVLVQDESVTENEIKMIGLDTLVGYNVVTPDRQYIGKVRGYSFNVNSGAVVSLELDSFGLSIIPSSLVSTYALFIEDVLEVVSDTVIVHEAAASRIQRLTKGFWDAQKVMRSMDEFGGFSDLENAVQPEYNRRRQQSSTSENQSELGEMDVDWELPMDYL